jgi:5-bromo-4-chloroindolyl phosphate hydrolysis protein
MPRGKTNAIEQLINSKYSNGVEITVAQLATEVGCTVQNVYIYIRKNPTRFTQVRRGVYQINSSGSIAPNNSGSGSMTFDASTEI